MKRISLYLIMWACAAMALAQDDHNFKIAKNLDVFNAIYKNLDMIYVDTLDADEVVGNGVKAMLRSLDPYTEYYPESQLKDLKRMITGKYAGIGALIRENTAEGCIMIDHPYPGMPASEVGLLKGDRILSIDDSTMVGKTTSFVSEHLRGDAGSSFKLKIRRPSTGKEMIFTITRRTIQMPCITYYGMLDDETGYLQLGEYTENSAKEVRHAFIDLKRQGMKRLIFDLRDNGGGSVQEAVSIVNMFVPRDKTIVTMRGKLKNANREYRTTTEPIDTEMPIVVLVNGNTASASEITAGTLQDMDRAVILGERTYGKGLAQITVDVPYNGQLKLTTSKYYIPSGRCIQAINYSHKNGGYADHVPDSLTRVFHTLGGREVRDGGGIKPDVEVKPDTITNLAYYLMNTRDSAEVVFDFEYDYIQKHPTIASPDEFLISDADFDDFKARVLASDFKYDKQTEKYLNMLKDLARFEGYYDDAQAEFDALEAKLVHNTERDLEINRELLKQMLSREIVRNYYHDAGAMRHSLRFDSQVKAAVDLLNDPERYKSLIFTGLRLF